MPLTAWSCCFCPRWRRWREERLLLVLGNMEHLPQVADELADLLADGPALCVLATSRVPLGLRLEHVYAVEPLPTPDLTGPLDPETVTGMAAVQLFVRRALAARPGFEVQAANAPDVAHLCVRLGGLPLALELAAAQVRLLPPGALLERLHGRWGSLRGDDMDRPERHATLGTALTWSLDLLSPPTRTFFARLGVFQGGFTLGAADVVGGAAAHDLDALVTLGRLVDAGLVRALPGEADHGRFSLLEVVRDRALDDLERSNDLVASRSRHATHFLTVAEQGEHLLDGPELGALERDLANLRAALSWSLEHDPALGLWLCTFAWRFWLMRAARGPGVARAPPRLRRDVRRPHAARPRTQRRRDVRGSPGMLLEASGPNVRPARPPGFRAIHPNLDRWPVTRHPPPPR